MSKNHLTSEFILNTYCYVIHSSTFLLVTLLYHMCIGTLTKYVYQCVGNRAMQIASSVNTFVSKALWYRTLKKNRLLPDLKLLQNVPKHSLFKLQISWKNKCDMIKGNESDVGNIDFELQATRGDEFLCFTLFLKFNNCSYLWNQMSDWDEIWIKM